MGARSRVRGPPSPPGRLGRVILERVGSALFDENCYVIAAGTGQPAVVVDPGVGSAAAVAAVLARHQLFVGVVLLTHGHPDHVWDAAAVAGEGPVLVPSPDLYRMDDPLAGLGALGDLTGMLGPWQRPVGIETIADGLFHGGGAEVVPGVVVRSLPAPGHTEGSTIHFLAGTWPDDVAAWATTTAGRENQVVALTGDVIFRGSVGRTDLPGGDDDVMAWTLRTLRQVIEPGTWLLPGHGPATTMAHELATNPFLATRR